MTEWKLLLTHHQWSKCGFHKTAFTQVCRPWDFTNVFPGPVGQIACRLGNFPFSINYVKNKNKKDKPEKLVHWQITVGARILLEEI